MDPKALARRGTWLDLRDAEDYTWRWRLNVFTQQAVTYEFAAMDRISLVVVSQTRHDGYVGQ